MQGCALHRFVAHCPIGCLLYKHGHTSGSSNGKQLANNGCHSNGTQVDGTQVAATQVANEWLPRQWQTNGTQVATTQLANKWQPHNWQTNGYHASGKQMATTQVATNKWLPHTWQTNGATQVAAVVHCGNLHAARLAICAVGNTHWEAIQIAISGMYCWVYIPPSLVCSLLPAYLFAPTHAPQPLSLGMEAANAM